MTNYRILRTGYNGSEIVEGFDEIDDMVQAILKNPNHIYSIQCLRRCEADCYIYVEMTAASIVGFLG